MFVAYPAGSAFLFIYRYLIRFAGDGRFSHSALDIKTYIMTMLKCGYRACNKRNPPARWFDPLLLTYVAFDDAIEQGALFCNMLHENIHSGSWPELRGAWNQHRQPAVVQYRMPFNPPHAFRQP